jgi:hypothetical protein
MTKDGYGLIGISRNHAADIGASRTILAHRLAWKLANGPIPDGLQIDHVCRNRACINADHLEAVTASENVRRSDAPVLSAFRLQAQRAMQREAYKTNCVHGHALTEDNVYADRRGFRNCKECQRERNRVWRAANPGWRQRYK